LAVARKRRPFTDQLIDLAAGVNTAETALLKDRRSRRRFAYDDYVALLLISPIGDRGRPIVLQAKDISYTGISVISRNMIYPGSTGAMQLVRSDGQVALVGVAVKASIYVGDMQHHTGMAFIPLPPGVSANEFLDRHGRLVLMNPMLRQNLGAPHEWRELQ
jgi:hypothetical protein